MNHSYIWLHTEDESLWKPSRATTQNKDSLQQPTHSFRRTTIRHPEQSHSSEKRVDVSVCTCVCCLHAPVDVCDSAHPCWKALVRQRIAAVGPRLSSTSRPKWVNNVCSHPEQTWQFLSYWVSAVGRRKYVWLKVTSAHVQIHLISNLQCVCVCAGVCFSQSYAARVHQWRSRSLVD